MNRFLVYLMRRCPLVMLKCVQNFAEARKGNNRAVYCGRTEDTCRWQVPKHSGDKSLGVAISGRDKTLMLSRKKAC